MSTQYLTPPNSRPLPKRLLSLQHPMQSPTNSRPTPYTYPSPTSPTSPGLGATTAKRSSRPCAPRRSVSFCGDPSASTYALASTSSCAHLTPDKRTLMAPPLERTLSSIGSRGNHSPPSQQMARPEIHRSKSQVPPTPPSSPPQTFHQIPPVPEIMVSTPSPSRPGLNPVQSSPSRNSTRQTSQSSQSSHFSSASSSAAAVPRTSHSFTSSRSSSYTINTPTAEITPSSMFEIPASRIRTHNGWLKSRHDINMMEDDEERDDGQDDDNDNVEMMQVDGMIERVEDLVMA